MNMLLPQQSLKDMKHDSLDNNLAEQRKLTKTFEMEFYMLFPILVSKKYLHTKCLGD